MITRMRQIHKVSLVNGSRMNEAIRVTIVDQIVCHWDLMQTMQVNFDDIFQTLLLTCHAINFNSTRTDVIRL